MKSIILAFAKSIAMLVTAAVLILAAFSVSPIYDFEDPRPFSGPDIFNPYAALDTTQHWKRANFHTHTRVQSLFNECDFWPSQVYDAYSRLGYDIVTFSNHNALTVHPFDTSLQVNVYEHGYNLFKYHVLVFGSGRVNRFDHILPVLTSQRQWMLDLLGRDADILQLNHPFRTNLTSVDDLECLTGYRLIELDSGVTTEQEYWDWALGAGHYSFGLANDDLHFPDRTDRIAVRCNMLQCDGADYESIRRALLSGCFYSMRVPDFGHGDWNEKYAANAHLPELCAAGVSGDTVSVAFSRPAQIKAVGQGGRLLCGGEAVRSLACHLAPDEPYVRFTAYFDDGVVIYVNPFARYDASCRESPYRETGHRVNVFLTVLYNLMLALVAAGCIVLLVRLPAFAKRPLTVASGSVPRDKGGDNVS